MSLKGRAVCNQARIGACRAPFLQQRHTLPDKLPQSAVSPWHQLRTLSVTLSLFVGLIVALVGTSVAFLEERAWERNIDRGLGETARLACQSVVDELSARDEPLDPQDLRDALHDLLSADPSLDVLTVLRVNTPMLASSTSEPAAAALSRLPVAGSGPTSTQRIPAAWRPGTGGLDLPCTHRGFVAE